MRNSSCEVSAIRDWRCMQQAPCRHGCGRPTARGFCGPIRSAPDCSAPPMAPRLPAGRSGRRIRTGARWRSWRAGCRRPARSGWNGCAASARRSARSSPAAARGLILPTAATAFWSRPPNRSAARCRWSNGCNGWSKASIRRSQHSRATACSSAPATRARSLLGFRNLTEAGLDEARSDALKQGRVETPIGIGHLVLQRVGTGADVGLVALIAPGAAAEAAHPRAAIEPPPQLVAPVTVQPIPDHAPFANSGEAPAEFALIDEFAETPAAHETAPSEPAGPPTPEYEQPAISGEAPAEFALIDEFARRRPRPRPRRPNLDPCRALIPPVDPGEPSA